LLNDSIVTPKGLMCGRIIPQYASFSKIMIDSKKTLSVIKRRTSDVRLFLKDNGLARQLSAVPYFNLAPLQLWVDRVNEPAKIINTGMLLSKLHCGENIIASFPVDLPKGTYLARFAIPSAVPEKPTVNSAYMTLTVSDQ